MQTGFEYLLQNSPYLMLLYILLEKLIPLFQKGLEIFVPARVAKHKLAEEKTNELKAREMEIQEKLADLQERDIVVKEKMTSTMISLEANQRHMETTLQVISTSMTTANQALVVLMDRMERRSIADAEAKRVQ